MPVIEVTDLRVELEGTALPVVEGVSFTIDPGEIVGLAGESGSGKTTIANALTGHARRGARIAGGTVAMQDVGNLLSLPQRQLDAIRGSVVAFVPQDPSASLNPSLRVGSQISELFKYHPPKLPRLERRAQIRAMLREVDLPDSGEFLRRYPHQLSGGQEQRVLLAMAFLQRPRLVIMDEPTTGLDVTVQVRILAMVSELCRVHGAAILYVTHDLSVLNSLADRVLIAYAGRLAERGSRHAIFHNPAHPYTQELLRAIPDVSERKTLVAIAGSAPPIADRAGYCTFAPRCQLSAQPCWEAAPPLMRVEERHEAACFYVDKARAKRFDEAIRAPRTSRPKTQGLLSVSDLHISFGRRAVLAGVSLSISAGEVAALVGESGSGKTTLARAIMGLVLPERGSITYDGTQLPYKFQHRGRGVRRELQYIYQSPFRSLNPRRTIGDSIRTPLELFGNLDGRSLTTAVLDSLERVGLPRGYIDQYPDQLSGGERQRVAIARALACNPRILLCDEITSALDVSVQAAIVDLLLSLQRDTGLGLLFITHDLALVRSISDRVIVIQSGRIVEEGDSESVLTNPTQRYTKTLLADTPSLRARTELRHQSRPTR